MRGQGPGTDEQDRAEDAPAGGAQPRVGLRGRRLGRLLALTALIVVIAMIAVGATAVLSVDEAGTVRTGAQSSSPFIPSVVPGPPDTIGSDLLVVDPETWDETLVAALQGRQLNGERSPDGRWIAYTERPGGTAAAQVFLLRADGKAHQLTHLGGAALDPTWSPDGRRIAFASNGRERLGHLRNGRERHRSPVAHRHAGQRLRPGLVTGRETHRVPVRLEGRQGAARPSGLRLFEVASPPNSRTPETVTRTPHGHRTAIGSCSCDTTGTGGTWRYPTATSS